MNVEESVELAVGAAQFGFRYGVANMDGQPTIEEVDKILKAARDAGSTMIDTAASYGTSEQVLGQIGVSDWQVVTKIPAAAEGEQLARGRIVRTVEESLSKLRIERLYGLLLHDCNALLGDSSTQVVAALRELKESGRVRKVGYSIYDFDVLNRCVDRYVPDVVQVPFNILDQRLIYSGWLDQLSSMGVEVHSRSAFLQGLLLMQPENHPAYFKRFADQFSRVSAILGVPFPLSLDVCLGFVKRNGIHRIVIGADTATQMKAIGEAFKRAKPYDAPDCAVDIDELIQPRFWKTKK